MKAVRARLGFPPLSPPFLFLWWLSESGPSEEGDRGSSSSEPSSSTTRSELSAKQDWLKDISIKSTRYIQLKIYENLPQKSVKYSTRSPVLNNHNIIQWGNCRIYHFLWERNLNTEANSTKLESRGTFESVLKIHVGQYSHLTLRRNFPLPAALTGGKYWIVIGRSGRRQIANFSAETKRPETWWLVAEWVATWFVNWGLAGFKLLQEIAVLFVIVMLMQGQGREIN